MRNIALLSVLLLAACATAEQGSPVTGNEEKQALPSSVPQSQQESQSVVTKSEVKIDELERAQRERDWMARYQSIVDLDIIAIGAVEEHGVSSCDFANKTISRHIQQLNLMRSEVPEFTSEYQRGNFGWLLDVHIKEIQDAYNAVCPNS